MHRLFLMAMLATTPALLIVRAAEVVVAPPAATDANARTPETRYESAFTGYQRDREQKSAAWREVNDDVHKAGGHMGIFGGTHARHGAKPADAAPQQENKK
jgi:hypothetical protein